MTQDVVIMGAMNGDLQRDWQANSPLGVLKPCC